MNLRIQPSEPVAPGLGDYNVLYFAAHGCYRAGCADQAELGVALSPAGGAGSTEVDGFLGAIEIASFA